MIVNLVNPGYLYHKYKMATLMQKGGHQISQTNTFITWNHLNTATGCPGLCLAVTPVLKCSWAVRNLSSICCCRWHDMWNAESYLSYLVALDGNSAQYFSLSLYYIFSFDACELINKPQIVKIRKLSESHQNLVYCPFCNKSNSVNSKLMYPAGCTEVCCNICWFCPQRMYTFTVCNV